jgi:hypothetical protein
MQDTELFTKIGDICTQGDYWFKITCERYTEDDPGPLWKATFYSIRDTSMHFADDADVERAIQRAVKSVEHHIKSKNTP